MPSFGPTSRKELIQFLRRLGFAGPYSGGKHQFNPFNVPNQIRPVLPRQFMDPKRGPM